MSGVIWQIAESAGVRLVRKAQPKPFDNQFVRDVVAMRREGLFQAVWIDADKIAVRTIEQEISDPPQRLSRFQVEQLIAAWKNRQRFRSGVQ